MEVTLRKYGNSTVAVLPPAILKDLGITAGQTMTLDTTQDGKITLAPKQRYSLTELIAQCDQNASNPADLSLWETTQPVGREVW